MRALKIPTYLLPFLFLFGCIQYSNGQHSVQKGKIYEFTNGQWFDGMKFILQPMYVADGNFVKAKPIRIDSVIDLLGKFVIPPFSEAHTHHLEGVGAPPEQIINAYLKEGVFYAKNPNNVRMFTQNLFDKINKPTSLDASFANGGLTASEGHPMTMFEDQVRPNIEPMVGKTERGWFNGKAYYTIDSKKDLEDKWATIISDKPDFIKTYLANSEDYGKQSPSSKYKLRSGLNPTLLPIIVAKAHKAGFRVAVHVETAFDFRTAINAGADEMAHMPGFYLFDTAFSKRYILTDEDAKLAAAKKVVVVTTLMTRTLVEDKSLLSTVKENQKKNLLLLKKYRVKLAIGSDHSDSPLEEIKAIRELNVFTNLELLKLWCENSARYIFPERKIGFLKPGYEASFLVLDGDPIKDWAYTQKILLKVKQGFSFGSLLNGQNASTSRENSWKEDLTYLKKMMPLVHVDLFSCVSKVVYDRYFTDLQNSVVKLSDNQVLVKILQLIALLKDGHSAFDPFKPSEGNKFMFHIFPLGLYEFPDGVYATRALPENKQVIGKKLVAVNGINIDKVHELIATIIPSDKANKYSVMGNFWWVSIISEYLNGLGIISDPLKCSFTFENTTGKRETVSLNAVPFGHGTFERMIDVNSPQKPLPLYRQNRQKFYWFTYLEGTKTLYISYNRAEIDPSDSLIYFSKRLEEWIKTHEIEKTVLDIRENDGGNIYTMSPLVRLLVNNGRVNQYGKFFVVLGRRSQSAAVVLANILQFNSRAILIGEPTLTSPNFMANPRPVVLPNSKLLISLSTIYSESGLYNDNHSSLNPAIAVPIYSKHFFNNEDPVMDSIQSFNPRLESSINMSTQNPSNSASFVGDYLYDPGHPAVITRMNNKLYFQIKGGELQGGALNTFLNTELFASNDTLYTNIKDTWLVRVPKNAGLMLYAKGNDPISLPRKDPNYKTAMELLDAGSFGEVVQYFKELKKNYPNSVISAEGTINALGYKYLNSANNIQAALVLFKLNSELYPNRYNTFDSLGEIYAIMGNKEEAIRNYKKALEIYPGLASAEKALEKLQQAAGH